MRPLLHDGWKDSSLREIVNLLFQVRTIGFLISHDELNGASGHEGRGIPILLLKIPPGLHPMPANIFGPMFREFCSLAMPRHRYEIVHSLTESELGRRPEDHYEIAAVAALEGVEIQDLRAGSMLLFLMVCTFEIPLNAAKCASNSMER
jgi:hypothetical protein